MVKPIYSSDNEKSVFNNLRKEAHVIVKLLESKRRSEIVLKAILFPAFYFLIYLSVLYWGRNISIFYLCYFLMGLMLVFVFLNTIHEAVHGTIFQSKRANNLYVYIFDLMGANSFMWKTRHIRFHHNYPNVEGWDTDIEQSKLARVFPNGPYTKIHKYQHIYLPLLYPLYLANWLLVRDFKDFFIKGRTVQKLIQIPKIEYVKLFLLKGIFLFYTVVLPKWILPISWIQVLIAFSIMLFTASVFSLFVLLSPHANTENEFPLPDDQNQLSHSWMMHMLITTNDVSHNNWFTRFFMGCFNYHVVHHLFPNINHAYYPELTMLLKQYAQEFKLPYRTYPLLTSLKNHYKLLKQNRMTEDIFEETM
ncbi:fatty acid desaturase [Chitinophagaceae bacterium LB-8]|uniref:Fatty acid desaturase n=1 Tax=Paraflavisolibacter caeni TaxID=2982496 RepID=A0A9X2XV52_9BACT|nr:fatty acid desaturase [Paraflavisolibacter caeni]MCU7549117.1 fatty acid desaturase [Paraflavisolibacter caeni]